MNSPQKFLKLQKHADDGVTLKRHADNGVTLKRAACRRST